MRTHGKISRASFVNFLVASVVMATLAGFFACCASCIHITYRPPRTRIGLSEINTNHLLNSTVAFLRMVEPIMTPANPFEEHPEPTWEINCSGFFIDDRHIVSAAHCFQFSRVIPTAIPGLVVRTVQSPMGVEAHFIEFGGAQWRGTVTGIHVLAEVTQWDDHNDIVILTVTSLDFTPRSHLDLAATVPAHGVEIYHVGHPLGVGWTMLRGMISNRITTDDRELDMVATLQLDLPVSPGSSGGPVVDSNGEVVAVINGYFNNAGASIGIARSVDVIRRLVPAE